MNKHSNQRKSPQGKAKRKKSRTRQTAKKKIDLGQLVAIFLIIAVLVAVLWALFPKTATIYFNGTADRAEFSITSDKQTVFNIKSYKEYGGRIVFGSDETATIYAVKASMPEEEIQRILADGFPDWESSNEVFPFINGSATLFSQTQSSSKSVMALTLEPPEDGIFTYDMEITHVTEEGVSKWNQIELKNFSAEPVIRLSSTCDINMKGTTKMIPTGLYRIIGCQSITFFAVPGGPEDSESGYSPQFNSSLEHFQFTNTEKGTLQITYYAEPESNEVGHIEVEGQVQTGQWPMLEISDIGQYPLPVEIHGRVEALTMAGESRYPSLKQRLADNSSALLLMIATAFFTMLLEKARGKKAG